MTNDRSVPFTMSLTLSQIDRLTKTLVAASNAGMLTSPRHRPNKLAAEFLLQGVLRLEKDLLATGWLQPEAPAAPTAPAPINAPEAPTPLNAERLATDPDARARARAALGFNPAPPAAAPPPSPLPEPEGLDWSRVP